MLLFHDFIIFNCDRQFCVCEPPASKTFNNYSLFPTCPKELDIILNAKVYVAAYIFGAFMTLVVTWIALYKLKKHKLVELFERVS